MFQRIIIKLRAPVGAIIHQEYSHAKIRISSFTPGALALPQSWALTLPWCTRREWRLGRLAGWYWWPQWSWCWWSGWFWWWKRRQLWGGLCQGGGREGPGVCLARRHVRLLRHPLQGGQHHHHHHHEWDEKFDTEGEDDNEDEITYLHRQPTCWKRRELRGWLVRNLLRYCVKQEWDMRWLEYFIGRHRHTRSPFWLSSSGKCSNIEQLQ